MPQDAQPGSAVPQECSGQGWNLGDVLFPTCNFGLLSLIFRERRKTESGVGG